ncbi:MAG: nucleoside kinase [Bacteroidales bacterium]|nr:nucleoside kinase [Bacteroidales bacterium]
MIKVQCLNTQHETEYPHGTPISEIAQKEGVKLKYPILGALVNNKVRDYTYRIHKPCQVLFFDITSPYGADMYRRSLCFVLFKVVSDMLPNVQLRILHSISGGKYCRLSGYNEEITDSLVARIKAGMQTLVERNVPFKRIELQTPQALEEYARHGMDEKARLFQYRKRLYTSIYALDDKINYYYGFLLPSTGYLTLFDIEKYEDGLLLKMPMPKRPETLSTTRYNPKLFAVYKLYRDVAMRMGVPYVMDLNVKTVSGEIADVIRIAEAAQENRFAEIAKEIHDRGGVKMVMISGPSSSGKTTTCKRISVQLALQGYRPVQVSVDDFFLEREQTPRDKNGEYDFETIEAIDLPLFNQTLQQLMEGKEVPLPTFDFTQGKKVWGDKKVQMQDDSILIIEGIHCLNPKLTASIPDEVKYKIFVSALTCISIDSQNPIPTTDNRLIRRIVRDHKYRGYSALDTLRRWQSVRNGEAKNIFPYQENADVMVNSALIFELGILKQYAVPVLREVPETVPEYAEACRLLKFLSYFKTIPPEKIPGTSILREFVGGSQFSY